MIYRTLFTFCSIKLSVCIGYLSAIVWYLVPKDYVSKGIVVGVHRKI